MDRPARFGGTDRSGTVGVLECMVAIVVILVMVGPLVGMIAQSSRSTRIGSRRLVLHLRARRHQAEVVATSFHVVAATAGMDFASRPLEPDDSTVYDSHVGGLAESTRVTSLDRDLVQVETSIRFSEPAVPGLTRIVTVRRLMASPTVSLEARWDAPRRAS